MGIQQNRRQLISITLTLIAVVVVVLLYCLTQPGQRSATFWISIGVLGFVGMLNAFFAAHIMFSDEVRQPPYMVTQFTIAAFYTVAAVFLAILNALSPFPTKTFFLIHLGTGVAFFLSLLMLAMAAAKSGVQKNADDSAAHTEHSATTPLPAEETALSGALDQPAVPCKPVTKKG